MHFIESLVAESRELFSISKEICTSCTIYRPRANLFYSKWVTPEYIYDSRVILANQKSLLTQLATT